MSSRVPNARGESVSPQLACNPYLPASQVLRSPTPILIMFGNVKEWDVVDRRGREKAGRITVEARVKDQARECFGPEQ